MQFNVQDKASVEAWKQRAEELNERANKLVNESADVLAEFKETAEGQVFDQVVEYSGDVIEGVNKVLDGMNEILTVVNKVVESILAKMQELVSEVGNTKGRTLG